MYYINPGRWAGCVVGPFSTDTEADSYIDGMDWRGARPVVVQIAPPKPKRRQVWFNLTPDEEARVNMLVRALQDEGS